MAKTTKSKKGNVKVTADLIEADNASVANDIEVIEEQMRLNEVDGFKIDEDEKIDVKMEDIVSEDMQKQLDLIEEYKDTNKKLAELSNIKDMDEMAKAVSAELDKTSELVDTIKKSVLEAEAKLGSTDTQNVQKTVRKLFMTSWNGIQLT